MTENSQGVFMNENASDGSMAFYAKQASGAPTPLLSLSPVNGIRIGVVNVAPVQGRLTLTAGTPVMTAASTAGATSVIYTGYKGRLLPMWDGIGFAMVDPGGDLSLLLSDATKSPAAALTYSAYDIFGWLDTSVTPAVPRISRGPVWSSLVARSAGTALAYTSGLLVNSVAITNGPAAGYGTYLGSIFTNGTSTCDWIYGGAGSGGVAGLHSVWNYHNRVMVSSTVTDNGVAYTYQTATIRQARAAGTNQITYIRGLIEDAPIFAYKQNATLVGAVAANVKIGIGDSSVTAFGGLPSQIYTNLAVAAVGSVVNTLTIPGNEASLGWAYAAALEIGDGSNANTFGTGTLATLSMSLPM